MKLSDHVEHLRSLIYKSFSNQFSRLGFGEKKLFDIDKIPTEYHSKRQKIENLIDSHTDETGSYVKAREKALDELSFTLFNRLAAIKVMEAYQLFPPIVTKEAEHGDRSFGHKMWLEQNPNMRQEELEGLREYFKYEFNKLGASIPLFHKDYPYALLPYVIELNEIIDAFNAVEEDSQVEEDIWQSDDVLGWLYESYNNVKKQEHKDSKAKTEYHKVSLQSQVYTPRWVVEFLVENSLGKMYLEMYPHSDIKNQFKIANAPEKRIREPKPLHEIKLIDPASGSGNFLLYAFEFFYKLYEDQIDNYGADYDEDDIAKLIIENNLHGVDLDDRAIQLAQLGLWIKAKQKRRSIGKLNFNVVSSDFFLPDFDFVYPIFKEDIRDSKEMETIETIWNDLQNAHKFGSLVRLNEKVDAHISALRNSGAQLFSEQEEKQSAQFKATFLSNLEKAFLRYATQQGNSFLTDKTKDAITFLRLITQKYDVATANPPYTDSSDFGPELKKFINKNYQKPYKFHTNLYATFIKRCYDLTKEDGKLALIHPHTFMFIKTFEDVRTFMIEKSHIDVMVDFGLDRVNLFGPGILLDATFYVLSKSPSKEKGLYFNLTTNLQEKFKKDNFLEALSDHCENKQNERVYELEQSKLKIIKSYPFIYWISDEFREKFSMGIVSDEIDVVKGISTGNNHRFLRFWFELNNHNDFPDGWKYYTKGGPFKKWFGNNWLLIDWRNNGNNTKSYSSAVVRNEKYYFKKGITYSAAGSKGASFRYMPEDFIIDAGGPGIYLEKNFKNINYVLGFLNSKLSFYIINCLNPTVNTNQGDLKRIPFLKPSKKMEFEIEHLTLQNIKISEFFNSSSLIEYSFKTSPFLIDESSELKIRIKKFFDKENLLNTQIFLNESIINENIFEIYELTDSDKAMVLAKEGESIGGLAVSKKAKQAYLESEVEDFPLDHIRDYIQNLPEKEFTSEEREAIENEFPQLYQSNNDLEEFCIRHQINPINVWYWFKESNVIPKQRMNDLAMEFLADMLREILMEDEDGIIPLVPNAGEKILLDRIEQKFIEKGFTMAQYSSFDSVLGRELNDYLNNHFFKAFSDHLNLFMYLPKTPFIWHLSSGPEQGFDCYIIIYKWNRDKLLSIRSRYIEQRERALENRQSDLNNKSVLSASDQNELDKIYKQLKEIESFKQKIDELLAEGYDPILDDGVGKNIAPLQKKKMIPYDVLTAGQLKKYLNADW
ncbi:BREX-1 system adenine-specific DNA-methyltransferase PglX [Weeksellaceae bacterium KMM 9724]|uniref:BREX-1 system adenine-specific DNA-methyltransferase PglX n=1 Tax=Profundicola chukchiensis TaxID=2961959 RepID=UPI002440D83C|nr:BREX-1 system adenine-specific DNA-methyltransferase PglX [Profundicola chukchiensis]MDG4950733.1 BREX-1 system adenine-specific DNA-methyltransferase PglX [Profundicola chukchiensis]